MSQYHESPYFPMYSSSLHNPILPHVQTFREYALAQGQLSLTSLSWPIYSPSQYAVPNVSRFKAQTFKVKIFFMIQNLKTKPNLT